jgi:hypothetical protein
MNNKFQAGLIGLNAFLLLFLFIFSLVYWSSFPIFAQENDAIAIQVRENPDRYSALRWYTEVKRFEGSPQSLKVDGYEAIRDGRTVYVNAGNRANNVDYSNIYLISYSQNSAPGTSDVFAGMLKNWTFNTNLIGDNDFGNCKISNIICQNDKDCKAGYNCFENKCHLNNEDELSCWRDKDCPANIFCSSAKAAITRKTLRYANLVDIRSAINAYYVREKVYPDLRSGTYVAGRSLSTWPSWNDTLALTIGSSELPVDPINIMGSCLGFDPKTCWNDSSKTFGGINGGSFVYEYSGEYVVSHSDEGELSCPIDGGACR